MRIERFLAKLVKLLIKHRLLESVEREPPVDPGLTIYATAGGRGHGATPDSPCNTLEAITITRFLSMLYPEGRNRIMLMGDRLEERFAEAFETLDVIADKRSEER